MKSLKTVLICLFLSGCTAHYSADDTDSFYKFYKTTPPHDNTAKICHGNNCRLKTPVTFKKQDLNKIAAPLRKTRTAATERAALRQVIANFEIRAAGPAGTFQDEYKTDMGMGDGEQDCVDEATNTTSYLLILQENGFLKFHTIERPAARWPPHVTAVIRDKKTGTAYVVDSWFHYNGVPAEIVPLSEWKDGWRPAREGLRLP